MNFDIFQHGIYNRNCGRNPYNGCIIYSYISYYATAVSDSFIPQLVE